MTDRRGTFVVASLAVSEVGEAVSVLDEVIFVVLEVVAVGVATIVDDDMVVETDGSVCEARGWGPSWGELGRLGGLLGRR